VQQASLVSTRRAEAVAARDAWATASVVQQQLSGELKVAREALTAATERHTEAAKRVLGGELAPALCDSIETFAARLKDAVSGHASDVGSARAPLCAHGR
jgi:hypothetical protein